MGGSVLILESEWRRDVARFSISGSDEIFSIIVACLGASAELIQSVASIILITKTHRAGPPAGEGDPFLDVDIAILGAAPAIYDAFRPGRSAFLTEALAWSRLFRTATFESTHACQARANMQRKLVALTGFAS